MPGAKQPGGRPREARHHPTAFSRWLEAGTRPVAEVAKTLGISVVAVYHLRNGRFAPGRDLAVRIEDESGGAVPVASWLPAGRPRARARRRRATGRAKAPASKAPPVAAPVTTASVALHASDEALTLAFLLLDYIVDPKRRRTRALQIPPSEHDKTAGRWALDIDTLARSGVSWARIQRAIEASQRTGSAWRTRVTSGAALLRWWVELERDLLAG